MRVDMGGGVRHTNETRAWRVSPTGPSPPPGFEILSTLPRDSGRGTPLTRRLVRRVLAGELAPVLRGLRRGASWDGRRCVPTEGRIRPQQER
jgi:hypothetical protein